MTKLCPRGKAAAKRKFKVYPSAYANAYASKICAGNIKDPSGVKRKDFRGPKPSKAMGGRVGKLIGGQVKLDRNKNNKIDAEDFKMLRAGKMGGGLMEATKRLRSQGLKNGGVARGCGAIMSDRRKKTKIV